MFLEELSLAFQLVDSLVVAFVLQGLEECLELEDLEWVFFLGLVTDFGDY